MVAVPGGRWLLGRGVQRNLPSCPAPGSDVPFSGRGEVQVRTMWGELDKSDSSQLLAEFLKNHHSLEESLVVQPEGDRMAVVGLQLGGGGSVPNMTFQCP